MSRITKKDTKPELVLRKALFSLGLRYRLHAHKMPGNPDLVLKKYNTVIFINGCFWHMHEKCRLGKLPKSNLAYWGPKLTGNVRRDGLNYQKLRELGWRVLIAWECEIKQAPQTVAHRIYTALESGAPSI